MRDCAHHTSTIETDALNVKGIGSARELTEGFLQIWRERSGGEGDEKTRTQGGQGKA